MNHAREFPFEALLEHREVFGTLSRLGLPGHVVGTEMRARVRAAIPGADFVSFDRREMIAIDFATTGFAAGAR